MLLFVKEFRDIRKKLLKRYLWPGKFNNVIRAWWFKPSNYYVYKFLLNLRFFEALLSKKKSVCEISSDVLFKAIHILCE